MDFKLRLYQGSIKFDGGTPLIPEDSGLQTGFLKGDIIEAYGL
jgi:hypothetical protein